jgi:hypothetical protein
MTPPLKVRATGSNLVPVYEALNANPRRFVGRRFDPATSQWIADGVAEVPDNHEYRAAIAVGDLALVEEAV